MVLNKDVRYTIEMESEDHVIGAHVTYRQCLFYSMGCYVKGAAEYIANHEQVNAAQHYHLAAEYIETLKIRHDAARKKLVNRRCWQASDGGDIREEELHSISDALLRNREIVQRELDKMQVAPDVEQDLAALFDLHSCLQSLADRILIVETEPRECLPLKSNEAMLSDIAIWLHDLVERVKCVEIASFDKGHMILKVKDYHLLKAKIESGAHTVIDSQPFCTHREGYKLLLRFYPTGYGPGAGTHMSVELVGLVGDCDQLLDWPFKPKVTFCLRGLGPDRPNIEKIVEVGDGLARPTAGQPPPTISCPLFASRHVTEDPSFYDSEQNCFFVEVMVDTSGLAI